MLKKKMMCLWSVAVFIAVMGFNVITFAGDLEPTAPPGPTMKTLDQIPPTWSQKLPAADRFELVLDGEGVLDKETGLVWEQSPSTTARTWSNALSRCFQKEVGGRKGWHLPTVDQLASLYDPGNRGGNPDLPVGHPFSTNVQSSWYWSSTTNANTATVAWVENFNDGGASGINKINSTYVWCVRGGQTYDGY